MSTPRRVLARLELESGGLVVLSLDVQPVRPAPEVGNIIVGQVHHRAQWARCLGIVTQLDSEYKTFRIVWQTLGSQSASSADPSWETCEDSMKSNILKSHTLVGKASLSPEPRITMWQPAGCDVREEEALILVTAAAKHDLPPKRLPKRRLPGNEQAFDTQARRSPPLRSTTPPPRPPPPSLPPPPLPLSHLQPKESYEVGDKVEAMSCGGGQLGSSCWAEARVIKRTGLSAVVKYTNVQTEPTSGRVIITAEDDTPKDVANKYDLPVKPDVEPASWFVMGMRRMCIKRRALCGGRCELCSYSTRRNCLD